jgi:hypothetical protein
VLELIASVIAFPMHREAAGRLALKGGKQLARIAGMIAALVGHLPQPYRTIHGS